jgi:hypothetical protein
MASPSVTYTFSNGTAADASQVNTNFTDLINGLTDGTKDLSISALTCAGTATLNGNINLGNASADDLTITASLAADLPIKTTGTYYIGSATKALLGVYFGNASNSNTALIKGGVTSSSYSVTLPLAAPTTGQRVIASSASALTFDSLKLVTVAITNAASPYTMLAATEYLTCDATSGAITVNLPAATGTGKVYYITKIDSSVNAVTLDGNASETINGSLTTTLNTQYESVRIVDAASGLWYILERRYPSEWASDSGFTVAGPTVTSSSFLSRRSGDMLEVIGKIIWSGAGTGAMSVALAGSRTFDTAKFLDNSVNLAGMWGHCQFKDSSASTNYNGIAVYNAADTLRWYFETASSGSMQAGSDTIPVAIGSGDTLNVFFRVPVTGWKG